MVETVIGDGNFKLGCKDPQALNYDPNATQACSDCCQYPTPIIGCRDPLAINFSQKANTDCEGCCKYESDTIDPQPSANQGGDVYQLADQPSNAPCPNPTTIIVKENGLIENLTQNCCNSNSLGDPGTGKEYYWYDNNCYKVDTCPTNVECVDCFNLDWWNDTYILNHNNQSLQITNPLLWTKLVDLVVNSGQTFYVNATNGNLLNDICCAQEKGIFEDGICYCSKGVLTETYNARCVSSISDFISLISTTKGFQFFQDNFQIIGPSLGLTQEQTNFILANLKNPKDTDSNGIPDNIQSKILVTKALNNSGGFYVNFGSITNDPLMIDTEDLCTKNGGFWDGTICMCEPIQGSCDVVLTDVSYTNIKDVYNNNIQIVTLFDKLNPDDTTPIGQACCNKIAKEHNLPWVWEDPYCYTQPGQTCLPIVLSLNNKSHFGSIKVPPCENDLEISMWVYFGIPENPCQPIPQIDDDIIVIDGKVCDVQLTPNTKELIISNPSGTITTPSEGGVNGTVTDTNQKCCYDESNPIRARISLGDTFLNDNLIQVKEYNSSADLFDKWVELKATLPFSGLTVNLDVNLEIYDGVSCCCDYEVYLDDISVNCSRNEIQLTNRDITCPGFDLTKVIDNKKSWVYNPGLPTTSTSTYDVIERNDGSFGLLNGQGTINRTFAPSLDANIPWRYTDYFTQSSTLEKHSNLVLNSKELWLTFDMCADCPISSTTISCLSGYTYSANTCYDNSGNTATTAITKTTSVKYLTILELENYKKQFQSFWIPFMEQFIPATTVWVAGERWCNDPCPVINVCDYDFELVASASSITTVGKGGSGDGKKSPGTVSVPTGIKSSTNISGTPNGKQGNKSNDVIPINDIGLTTTQKITLTNQEANIDIQSYINKFTSTEIIIQ